MDRQVDLVARIGAGAITPDVAQFGALTPAQAGRLIGDAGLACAALTHRAFGFADPTLIPAARERLERSIATASKIGAPCIVMTTGGRGTLDWRDAVARFAEAVAPCADLARQAGVTLGIEPTSHLYADASIVHRLTDCHTVARAAGIGVVNDLFACWVDADIDMALVAATALTSLVQVSDYVPGDRGLPCRAVPGDGAIRLERLLPAIIDAGYAGYFDLEIIGPRLLTEGVAHGLQRAAAHIGRILDTAGLTG
ncbi:sugar phosphate isomerase/epimerase family protein [Novosphingobium sp. MMS21-SN21R]|uniref:sugar phosphate isomerase/epimerase family protein n=1 Tax=Novosphingobium sp. MMS21-SN21R TaxID=2969298 RepID=UPI002884D171|nr:sugar phosphate isomerase/epimerase family protein [Novosphingobium sp. MMS21-SN21R]MDT0509816.1 sugar phosphate isomerase/epimerase family protein [Novosphingobium sp. MMS21-SN21R]